MHYPYFYVLPQDKKNPAKLTICNGGGEIKPYVIVLIKEPIYY